MPDPLRLAIIGAGWAGRRQAEAAAELGGRVQVVTLLDNDPDHLAATAAELGIDRTATELDELLGDPDVDAVSICTPHGLHARMTMAAAEAGKHVLVEKPMATTVAEATAMIEAAARSNVVLYVAESEVYGERMRTLRRIVREGEHIGELTFAACVSGYRAPNPTYAGRRAWLTDPQAGGTGTWMLQGIHAVAALRHVLGEVVSVYVLDHRARSFERPDLEATMSGIVELESGVAVWLVQTTETDLRPLLTGFRLYGDRGVVVGHDDGYEIYVPEDRRQPPPTLHAYPAESLSPYALELLAFADHVAGSADGPTTGWGERRSLAILEAGVESARTRLPVDLRERYPGILDDPPVTSVAGRPDRDGRPAGNPG